MRWPWVWPHSAALEGGARWLAVGRMEWSAKRGTEPIGHLIALRRAKILARPRIAPPCATLWHIDVLTLPKTKEDIMFEIIISVSLYIGAIALLVKGAITYCEQCPE